MPGSTCSLSLSISLSLLLFVSISLSLPLSLSTCLSFALFLSLSLFLYLPLATINVSGATWHEGKRQSLSLCPLSQPSIYRRRHSIEAHDSRTLLGKSDDGTTQEIVARLENETKVRNRDLALRCCAKSPDSRLERYLCVVSVETAHSLRGDSTLDPPRALRN